MIKDDIIIPFDYIWYAILGLFLVTIDQFFKYIAVSTNNFMFSLFSCELKPILNYGLLFGFFDSKMFIVRFALIVFTATLLIIVYKMAKRRYILGHHIYAETAILAGGFSNILDRFFYGGVVDFFTLNFLFKNFYVVGNCADFFIFIGIVYLVFFQKDII